MTTNPLPHLFHNYTQRKVDNVKPFLPDKGSILDFGCGNLSFAIALKHIKPKCSLTGIDVVDFGIRHKHVKFATYQGSKMPFKNNSFDIVISYHVLHHCEDPFFNLRECIRVSRKSLLIVEPVYRFKAEKFGMSFMDLVFNLPKSKQISMTFNYQSLDIWKGSFKRYGLQLQSITDVELFPSVLPVGRSYLFELYKKY